MPKRLSIILLIISSLISIFLVLNFFFSPTKRLFKNYKNSITGVKCKANIYSDNGTLLKELQGNEVYIKTSNNIVEIHIFKKKYIFVNATVIIEEL
ncbi:MAG: hypothetical protein ACRCTZ_03295 [Sarcina sp.]